MNFDVICHRIITGKEGGKEIKKMSKRNTTRRKSIQKLKKGRGRGKRGRGRRRGGGGRRRRGRRGSGGGEVIFQ